MESDNFPATFLTAHSASCGRSFLFILFNRQTMAVGVWCCGNGLTWDYSKLYSCLIASILFCKSFLPDEETLRTPSSSFSMAFSGLFSAR